MSEKGFGLVAALVTITIVGIVVLAGHKLSAIS